MSKVFMQHKISNKVEIQQTKTPKPIKEKRVDFNKLNDTRMIKIQSVGPEIFNFTFLSENST